MISSILGTIEFVQPVPVKIEQAVEFIPPLPAKYDGCGIEVATGYTLDDWFSHIAEEVTEAKAEACHNNREGLAEELTDVITVCTSFLNALGFDQKARAELQRKVNIKNRKRGYLS